jgi:hypothetical protein
VDANLSEKHAFFTSRDKDGDGKFHRNVDSLEYEDSDFSETLAAPTILHDAKTQKNNIKFNYFSTLYSMRKQEF